ncbi:alpha/beta hydrolase [Nocardia sp. NPDC052112]|uniref:alpha/beta fold hydrolase n=1 Tax=Nocardia sp. NPDC052112 TaxID=3155646 RepID=UPI00343B5A4B
MRARIGSSPRDPGIEQCAQRDPGLVTDRDALCAGPGASAFDETGEVLGECLHGVGARAFVVVGQQCVRDTEAPAGRPAAATVVFGHGLLFGGWMFQPQIEVLCEHYRCVTIDWRGQGASPATTRDYDMDTRTGDAVALIRRLEVAPVHWVGLSMGGFVGLRIAARLSGYGNHAERRTLTTRASAGSSRHNHSRRTSAIRRSAASEVIRQCVVAT